MINHAQSGLVHFAVTVRIEIPTNEIANTVEYATYIVRAFPRERADVCHIAHDHAKEAYELMGAPHAKVDVLHTRVIEHGTIIDLATERLYVTDVLRSIPDPTE